MDANTQPDAAAPSTPAIEVPRNPEAYAKWRRTGELPQAEPDNKKPANGGNAETSEDNDSRSHDNSSDKGASASETDNNRATETKPKSKAQARLDEILADLKAAGLTPAELKTFKREQQAQAQGAKQQQAPPEKTEKPPERPKRPKFEDFDDTESYEAALDKYEDELAEFNSNRAIEKFKQTQAQQERERDLLMKLADAKQRYGDEAEAVIARAALELGQPGVPQAIEIMIDGSPVMMDLMYALGQDPELLKLCSTNPGKAIRQIALLEHQLQQKSGEAADLPERNAQGQFVSKKVSKAPPPGEDVGGTKGTPPDEVEAAVKAGDFRTFRNAENRKDLARLKGQ